MPSNKIVSSLEEIQADAAKKVRAHRRLHALANRILDIPRPPESRVEQPDHRKRSDASAPHSTTLSRLIDQVHQQNSTTADRKKLFDKLLPKDERAPDDDDDDSSSIAGSEIEGTNEAKSAAAAGVLDPERPWRIHNGPSARQLELEEEKRRLRRPISASMRPSAAVRTLSPTAGENSSSSISSLTGRSATGTPFEYLRPVGFAALRKEQAEERKKKKKRQQEMREQQKEEERGGTEETALLHLQTARAGGGGAGGGRRNLSPVLDRKRQAEAADKIVDSFWRRRKTSSSAAAAAAAVTAPRQPQSRDRSDSTDPFPPTTFQRTRMFSQIEIVPECANDDISFAGSHRASIIAASGGGSVTTREGSALSSSNGGSPAPPPQPHPLGRRRGTAVTFGGEEHGGEKQNDTDCFRRQIDAAVASFMESDDDDDGGDDREKPKISFHDEGERPVHSAEDDDSNNLHDESSSLAAPLSRSATVVSGIFHHHGDDVDSSPRSVGVASDLRLKVVENEWPLYEFGQDAQIAAMRAPAAALAGAAMYREKQQSQQSSSPNKNGPAGKSFRASSFAFHAASSTSSQRFDTPSAPAAMNKSFRVRPLTGAASFRGGRPVQESEEELREQYRQQQRREKPLKAVLEHEAQMAREQKEQCVTLTDRFLQARDGSARPLRSTFLRALATATSKLPATSWHVDFSVLDREATVWKCFSDRFYGTINSPEQVVLGAVTFSGCARGFDRKEFSIPEPPSLDERTAASSSVNSTFLSRNDDENSATAKLTDSQWTSSVIMRAASSSSSPSPLRSAASSSRDKSKSSSPPRVLQSVQRLRQRRAAEAAHNEHNRLRSQQNSDDSDENTDAKNSKRVFGGFSLSFLQCSLHKSADFFRQLASQQERLKLGSLAVEHCKWPRRRFMEDEDDGKRSEEEFEFNKKKKKKVSQKKNNKKSKSNKNDSVAAETNADDDSLNNSRSGTATPSSTKITPHVNSLQQLRRVQLLSPSMTPKSRAVTIPTPPVSAKDAQLLVASAAAPRRVVAFIGVDEPPKKEEDEDEEEQPQKQIQDKKKQKQTSTSDSELETSSSDDEQEEEEEEEDDEEDCFRGLRDPDEDFGNALIHLLEAHAASLTSISFRGTSLGESFVFKFSDLLRSKQLKALSHLDLGLTGIETIQQGPQVVRTLASGIAHAGTSLRVLDFTGTPFSPPHVGIAFCAAVRANVFINEVHLAGCDRNSTRFEKIMNDMLAERREEKERVRLEREKRRELRRKMHAATVAALSTAAAAAANADDAHDADDALSSSASSASEDDFSGLRQSKSVRLIDNFAL